MVRYSFRYINLRALYIEIIGTLYFKVRLPKWLNGFAGTKSSFRSTLLSLAFNLGSDVFSFWFVINV